MTTTTRSELLRRYEAARERHAEALRRHLGIHAHQPGTPIAPPAEGLTPDIIDELARLANEEEAAERAWLDS